MFRILNKITAAFFFLLALFPSSGFACSVCFGDPNTRQSKALTWAVGFLLVVIGGILASIISLAISWSRRAKALEQKAAL